VHPKFFPSAIIMNNLAAAFTVLIPLLISPAFAEDSQAAAPGQPSEPGVSSYCANIADQAADARFAWQTETLTALKKEIEDKIAALEAKRAEYEEWLKKRNDALAQAESGIVNIYAKMKPDAASKQLSAMDVPTAAAILHRLNVRNASAILNEMDPDRAAELAKAMSEVPSEKKDGAS
jgi:flagellar motility protein MotE (MotC chaperone)